MFPRANSFDAFFGGDLSRFIRPTPLPTPQPIAPPITLGMTEDDESDGLQDAGSSFGEGSGGGGAFSAIGSSGGRGGISAFSFARKRNLHGGEKEIDINYGHSDSGRVYSYKVVGLKEGQSVSRGSIVTLLVTHWRTGRDFKTMGVVRHARRITEEQPESRSDLKTVGPDDVGRVAVRRNAEGKIVQRLQTYSPQSRLPGWQKHHEAAWVKYQRRVARGGDPNRRPSFRTIQNAWRRDSRRRRNERHARQVAN